MNSIRSSTLPSLLVAALAVACAPNAEKPAAPSKSPRAETGSTTQGGTSDPGPSRTEAAGPARALRPLGKRLAHSQALRGKPLPMRVEASVDVDATVARLKGCGADGLIFDIGNSASDWPDCKALAKGFAQAELKLWVAIRLPDHRANSKPFLGNFDEWARQVAALGAEHESVVALLLPELEQGRNSRFVHGPRTNTMRSILNAEGLSLLASVHDPEAAWIGIYRDGLDGLVLRWTKFNQLSNLTGMLAGFEALCPKTWKRYLCLETRRWGGSTQPPDPTLIAASLRAGWTRGDGVVLRQLDLKSPAEHSASKSGNSVYFEVLKAFSASVAR